jgi:phosphate transport system permease protein
MATVIPLLLCAIAFEVFRGAWPALHTFGFSFLTSSRWDAVNGQFGAAPAIFGTLVQESAISVPPWSRRRVFRVRADVDSQPVAFLVDLLAWPFRASCTACGEFCARALPSRTVIPFIKDTLHLGNFPVPGPAYGYGMLAAG